MTPEEIAAETFAKQTEGKVVSVGQVLPDVIVRLTKLAEESAVRRQKIESACSNFPKTAQACREHPTAALPLNIDETSRISQGSEQTTPFYGPCPLCKAEDKARRFRAMGIPDLYIGLGLDSFECRTDEDRVNLSHARRFAGNPAGALAMLGGVGNGKTMLACAVLQTYGRGVFVGAIELVDLRVRCRTFGAIGEKAIDRYERLIETGLLVVDECGDAGTHEAEAMGEVIGHRYSERLPFVLTSNLTRDQLADRWGPRIEDRLKQCAKLLTFTGDSRRAEKRKAFQ